MVALQSLLGGFALPQTGSVTNPQYKAGAPALAKYEAPAKAEEPKADAVPVERPKRGRPSNAEKAAAAEPAPKADAKLEAAPDVAAIRNAARDLTLKWLKEDQKRAAEALPAVYKKFGVTKGSELKDEQIRPFYDALCEAMHAKSEAPKAEAENGDDW